jgi:rubrerythrin
MATFIGKWILARIVKSALVFERNAIDLYQRLREKDLTGALGGGLSHLLEEEEMHWRILTETAEGRLGIEDLERVFREHLYAHLHEIRPLGTEALAELGGELERALKEERDTFVFYSNLRRASRIPVVRKAFELLADMEREHVDIITKLLGRESK